MKSPFFSLALGTLMGGQIHDLSTYTMSAGKSRSKQMDLTPEELEKLAGLTGREKKLYVKELKQKYMRSQK